MSTPSSLARRRAKGSTTRATRTPRMGRDSPAAIRSSFARNASTSRERTRRGLGKHDNGAPALLGEGATVELFLARAAGGFDDGLLELYPLRDEPG